MARGRSHSARSRSRPARVVGLDRDLGAHDGDLPRLARLEPLDLLGLDLGHPLGHRRRGGAGVVVGAGEPRDDVVDRPAHPDHRASELVARGAQLLDLDEEHPPPLRGLGEHPAPGLLGLLDHQPAPLPGPVEQRVAVEAGPLEDRGHVGLGALVDLAGVELGLGDPLRGGRLGADLDVGGLLLGVPDDRVGGLLGRGDEPGRLLVRVAEDLGALLPERGGQAFVVDVRVGGALFGVLELPQELFLTLLPRRSARPRAPERKEATSSASTPFGSWRSSGG